MVSRAKKHSSDEIGVSKPVLAIPVVLIPSVRLHTKKRPAFFTPS
jgi:hypothetical protein